MIRLASYRTLFLLLFALLPFSAHLFAEENEIFLRDNLKRAQKGDFIVTAQGKSYTLFHIFDKKNDNTLTIEEITIPISKVKLKNFSWRQWVYNRAPGNTAHLTYIINLTTGQISDFFSFTKNEWCTIPQSENFLSTLLNLRLYRVPKNERRKIGHPPPPGIINLRRFWQPQMTVDGHHIEGVAFDAWTTKWPKDNSELSGKTIEVYVPEDNEKYPSYFPYWLQISGLIGKAKVRIIDSGTGLVSPVRMPVRSQQEGQDRTGWEQDRKQD